MVAAAHPMLSDAAIRRAMSQCDDAWVWWTPRPDKPEQYDEQTGFVDSGDTISFLSGGNGCLGAEQLIFDPVDRRLLTIGDITRPFHVWSRNTETGDLEIGMASAPFIKGRDRIYRVNLSSGEEFIATGKHRVLDCHGRWRRVEQLHVGDRLLPAYFPDLSRETEFSGTQDGSLPFPEVFREARQWCALRDSPDSTIAAGDRRARHSAETLTSLACLFPLRQGDDHWFQRPQCSRANYCRDLHRHGGTPPWALNSGQEFAPQRADVPERTRNGWRRDDSGISLGHIQNDRQSGHPSRNDCAIQESLSLALQNQTACKLCSLFSGVDDRALRCVPSSMFPTRQSRDDQQSLGESFARFRTNAAFRQVAMETAFSQRNSLDNGATANQYPYVTAIEFVRQDVFYDVHVWPHNNYEAAGVWHHNSGKSSCACLKCARFLTTTPAPRPNCPFWIVSASYETVCAVCWDEKLWGMGFLPKNIIDIPNISWYQPKRNWPFAVPLKKDSNGNNWVIEFKSYEQGRDKMQARSIGGAWFSESVDWSIFLEVFRGCRDHLIPGSVFSEFTPADPSLSVAIEKYMDSPPKGWRFFRCNTELNTEISQEWLEAFKAAIPDEMLATRMTGALASYQGAIYQSFNPKLHTARSDEMARHPGMTHHRGIDWGASAAHPFVCVWACYDGIGNYLVYDEYWSTSQEKITQDHAVEILARSLYWGWPKPGFFDKPARSLKTFVEDVRGRAEELGWHDPDASRNGNGHPMPPAAQVSTYGETYADPSRPGEINAFNRFGLNVMPAMNAVHKGINTVRSLLKINPATKEPRLLFHERCCHCLEEHRKYRWKPESRTPGAAAPPPTPLKKADDTCDANRYLLHSVEGRKGLQPATTTNRDLFERTDVQLNHGARGYVPPAVAGQAGFFKK